MKVNLENCLRLMELQVWFQQVQWMSQLKVCAIIWSTNIKGTIIKVDINNNRLCVVYFILNCMLFLMLNAYMPCDRCIENREYVDVMNMIQQLIQSLNPKFIIYGGTLTLRLG